MAVLDTAKALFKARPRLCMDMPEWGNGEDGKPFRVYYRTPNAMTVAAALEAAKGNQVESMARLITLCAEDGDGKRLFREAEYHDLMVETDPIAMARLAKAINEGTGLTAALVDAAEKN